MFRNVASKFFSGVLLTALLVNPGPAPAQSPFGHCAVRSAANASLILPDDLDIRLDGTKYDGAMRVAIFNPAGECTGAAHWTGSATTLTAWGTDQRRASSAVPDTVLTPGDSMHVHIFHPELETTYTTRNSRIHVSFRDRAPHLTAHARYVPDGIYVVEQIRIESTQVDSSE